MFGFKKQGPRHEITAVELHAMMKDHKALVVDVREADEFSAGHIPGAINMPLSDFSTGDIPDGDGRTVVLHCAGGKRSGQALGQCLRARVGVDTVLTGGISAWQSAGLPIEYRA